MDGQNDGRSVPPRRAERRRHLRGLRGLRGFPPPGPTCWSTWIAVNTLLGLDWHVETKYLLGSNAMEIELQHHPQHPQHPQGCTPCAPTSDSN